MADKPDPLSIQRENYSRSVAGPLLLTFGRILSIPLQHFIIITKHPLSIFGTPRPPTDGTIVLPFLPQQCQVQPRLETLFLSMTGVLIAKQGAWMWGYRNEYMTLAFAFFGITAPAIYESLSALIFTASPSNPLYTPPSSTSAPQCTSSPRSPNSRANCSARRSERGRRMRADCARRACGAWCGIRIMP